MGALGRSAAGTVSGREDEEQGRGHPPPDEYTLQMGI